MKVKLHKDYKEFFTIRDLEIAKAIIANEKTEDEWTAAEWAEYAVSEALKGKSDYLVEVMKAEAVTAKNCRVWNAYPIGDVNDGNSHDIDVWIDATAKTAHGFIVVGAYLSDIWGTCSGESPTYQNHEYIEYYTRKE